MIELSIISYISYLEYTNIYICLPFKVEVIEGDLECPESGRKFPIQEGIPNMLLREDEL